MHAAIAALLALAAVQLPAVQSFLKAYGREVVSGVRNTWESNGDDQICDAI